MKCLVEAARVRLVNSPHILVAAPYNLTRPPNAPSTHYPRLARWQITRHKAEVRDEQGAVIGELELATKPVDFGRKDAKYRLSISSPAAAMGGSPSAKSPQDRAVSDV